MSNDRDRDTRSREARERDRRAAAADSEAARRRADTLSNHAGEPSDGGRNNEGTSGETRRTDRS